MSQIQPTEAPTTSLHRGGKLTPTPKAETESNVCTLAAELLQLIDQARGELDIRKLYARPVQP